jgi:hypothetical protein
LEAAVAMDSPSSPLPLADRHIFGWACTLLLLLLASCASSQKFPWTEYQPTTVATLVVRYRPDMFDRAALRRVYMPPQRFRSTVSVRTIGAERPADTDEFLKNITGAIPGTYKKELLQAYRTDLVFVEDDVVFSTPILNDLIDFLKEETQSSKVVEIYYYFIGMINEKPVLLIREFQTRR